MNETSSTVAEPQAPVKRAWNFKDLTGQRFRKLTVIRLAPKLKPKVSRWSCLCDCGKEIIVEAGKLKSGNTGSCGCLHADAASLRIRDLTGQRFGKLLVLGLAESDGTQGTKWICRCDCGKTKSIHRSTLLNNTTRSCGCYMIECTIKRSTKHGQATRHGGTSIHSIWCDIVKRTSNPNFWAWDRYGGRGIKLHEAWKDFRNFYAAVGDPPPGMTLDRVNNDGNYEPGNVRWATRLEQANNRHDNVKIEWRGKVYTLTELSVATGITRQRLRGWYQAGRDVAARVEESLL